MLCSFLFIEKTKESNFGRIGLPLFAVTLSILILVLIILAAKKFYDLRYSGSHLLVEDGRRSGLGYVIHKHVLPIFKSLLIIATFHKNKLEAILFFRSL